MIDKSLITYQMVAGSAFKPLAARLLKMGEPVVNPLLTVGFVAEDEGQIVGHSVIQSIPFILPFGADIGYGETLKELFRMTQDFIIKSNAPRVFAFTKHRAMEMMMARVGFKSTDNILQEWRREE